MTTNEILLVLGSVGLVVIVFYLMSRTPQPLRSIVKLLIGALFLVLFWFFTDRTSFKVLMTLFIFMDAAKTLKEYRVYAQKSKTENE